MLHCNRYDGNVARCGDTRLPAFGFSVPDANSRNGDPEYRQYIASSFRRVIYYATRESAYQINSPTRAREKCAHARHW